MSKQYSGIKKVEYSLTGANTFSVIGEPLPDSAIKNEVAKVETARGTNLYAGLKKDHSFSFPDTSAFSALETIMKADTALDIRVTYLDDTTEIIATDVTVQVVKTKSTKVGELNGFTLSYTGFSI